MSGGQAGEDSTTGYFVELPVDDDGNTALAKAVVEARLAWRRGALVMIPVAPAPHATRWPGGWRVSLHGGWARTEGPARMLLPAEWRLLVRALPPGARVQDTPAAADEA